MKHRAVAFDCQLKLALRAPPTIVVVLARHGVHGSLIVGVARHSPNVLRVDAKGAPRAVADDVNLGLRHDLQAA